MKRITPLVHQWTRYEAAQRIDVSGHFVQSSTGEPGVLIDPVPFNDGDADHVRELGGAVAVAVTGPRAVREAASCAALFGCPIVAAAPVAERLRSLRPQDVQALSEGELPAGLLALPLDGQRDPGETAFLHRPTGSLLVGEAVVGVPAGGLSLPPGAGE